MAEIITERIENIKILTEIRVGITSESTEIMSREVIEMLK